MLKEALGVKGHRHHWMHKVGDCSSKNDGEACSFQVAGRCIPTGKCPVFHGETVCKPYDAHPPQFVTQACEGKKEGDKCQMWLMSGTCKKMKYESDLVCNKHFPVEVFNSDETKSEAIVV